MASNLEDFFAEQRTSATSSNITSTISVSPLIPSDSLALTSYAQTGVQFVMAQPLKRS